MRATAQSLPLEARASTRTDALAHLLLTLSHTFSYPSLEYAAWTTSCSYFYHVAELLELAQVNIDSAWQRAVSFCNAAALDPGERAHSLRVEHTRLFIVSPRLVPLVGTRWVESLGSLAQRQSERVLVNREYQALGLRNCARVNEPADHLVSELDYAAYVTAAEYQAWTGNDAAGAHEWKRLRDKFVVDHLSDLAFGVSSAVSNSSQNPFLRFHAALLERVVQTCMP